MPVAGSSVLAIIASEIDEALAFSSAPAGEIKVARFRPNRLADGKSVIAKMNRWPMV
jgi:hypothetical protein